MKRGRPTVQIDAAQLEKLCMLHCTDAEIAAFFGVTERTIERRKKHASFAEAMARGRAKGRVSLRRAQWSAAEKGSNTMLIWLGKQLLGQKDKVLNEHSGVDGSPIEYTDARQRLADLLARRAPKDGASEVSQPTE